MIWLIQGILFLPFDLRYFIFTFQVIVLTAYAVFSGY